MAKGGKNSINHWQGLYSELEKQVLFVEEI